MIKKPYYAPESDIDMMLEQAMICESAAGGTEDYDLVDYQW